MYHKRIVISTIALLSAIGAALSIAGPINPPAGAVSSTYKTLSDVEPRIAISLASTPGDINSLYKITAPGSYYLTGNIQGVTGKHGIEIAVGNVTIDLKGFAVLGTLGSLDGISVTANRNDIAILNGSVRGWGGDGIAATSATNSHIKGISVSGNGAVGIRAGYSTIISDCVAQQNGATGIVANGPSTITDCAAYENSGNGISASSSTISACSAGGNTSSGIQGLLGSTVIGCSAYNNGTDGVTALDSCLIADCMVENNNRDGIRVDYASTVRGNMCRGNGYNNNDGANIHATSNRNRIEGNTCVGADRGVDIDAANNIIIRNTCTGNTLNWSIVANNVYGPIIDRTAPASAAVNGNAAASVLSSTDPNANFTY